VTKEVEDWFEGLVQLKEPLSNQIMHFLTVLDGFNEHSTVVIVVSVRITATGAMEHVGMRSVGFAKMING